uniref:Protein Ycf2 n=1 Tax=Sphaerocarpos texanus TaxID=37410 RepID=A0A8F8SQ14_9MARC|nr:Ycf2 [Sphaerocarpos texanus]
MKQKLPKKKILYKILDLDEIKKKKFLGSAWTKWSLIRLLIRIFSNKQHFINLFDFQFLTSLFFYDLRNSKNKKSLLLNIFIFLTLSFFFYFLNLKKIVEQKSFDLIKVQKQNYYEKSDIGIYKNYFPFLNIHFDLFLHNFFSCEKKRYKNSFFNWNDFNFIKKKKESVNLQWWKFLVLEQIISNWEISEEILSKMKLLLEKKHINDLKHFFEFYINHKMYSKKNWEYYFNSINSNFNQNSLGFEVFLAFCEKILFEISFLSKEEKHNSQININYYEFLDYLDMFGQKMLNQKFPWWNQKIFKNLQSFDESNKKVVESYFLVKEKGSLYFHNYIEFSNWYLYKNNSFALKQKKLLNYFNEFDKLNKFEFFFTIEDIISNHIYEFSKYVLYEKKSKSTSNQIFYKKFDLIFHLIFNPKIFFNSDNFLFDWIKKNFYISNKPFLKSVLIYLTISNQSFFFFKLKNEKLFDTFFTKDSVKKDSKCIMTNFFSNQNKIANFQKSIYYKLFEILSINQIDSQFLFNKVLSKKKNKKQQVFYLQTNKNFDSIRMINLWKTKNYSKNFLSNSSFLLNPTYDKIEKNKNWNKKNNLFLNFIYFFYSNLYNYKKLNIFLNFVSLKKNETLNVYIQILNKIYKKLNVNVEYKRKSQILRNNERLKKKKNKKKLLKTQKFILLTRIQKKIYIFLNNSIQKLNYSFNKFLYFQNIINKNLISWKNIGNNFFIYKVQYKQISFNKKNIKFFSFSKKIVFDRFKTKYIYLNRIPIIFFKFKQSQFFIKKIQNFFDKSSTQNFKKNTIYKIYNFINENLTASFYLNDKEFNVLIKKLFIDEINNKFLIQFFEKYIYIFYNKNQEILFNPIKNKQLLQNFFDKRKIFTFVDFLQKSEFNYYNQFFFYLEKKNNNKIHLLYLRLFYLFFKYKKISFNKIKILLSKKKNYLIIKSQLSNDFLIKNLYKFLINFLKLKNRLISNDFYDFLKILNSLKNNSFKKTSSKSFIQKRLKSTFNNIFIKSYYKIFLSKFLNNVKNNNYLMFDWINPLILYSKNFEYKIQNKIEKNKNNKPIFYQNNKKKKKPNYFKKKNGFQIYSSWFFTLEWWEYNTYILLETIPEGFYQIKDFFEYLTSKNNKLIGKFLNLIKISLKSLFLTNSNLKWNARFFNEVSSKKKYFFNFVWFDFIFINNFKKLHWGGFSLVVFIFLFYQKFFSILIGSDFIHLWKNFEIIKYLTDASRGFYFTKLLRHNKTNLNKTENLLISFFLNLMHYILNVKFYFLTKKNLTKWLISNKILDFSRRKRKLLVQSLITHNKITEYGLEYDSNQQLFDFYFGYHITTQKGLLYLQYLSKIFQKNLINKSLDFTNKWIFFAFWQKIFSSQVLWQIKNFYSGFQNIPVPLQFGLSYSKGFLLIGPIETGRSYLIKNLAAESYVPLLKISINKLLYNKPDIITESWMNILIESLRRLKLILDFAKKMSPCIIWVQNIHQLNVNHFTQNVESDPTFLLGILLKYFQIDLIKAKKTNNIIVIGSTNLPKKVDPALISPNRLDKIINVRLFNISQRKKKMTVFLKKKNFQLKKKKFLNEFGSRTMGFNLRDLTALTNEILLVSITKNKSFVDTNTFTLAFHRQILGLTYTNNKQKFHKIFKILIYKVGKTIVQNILIKNCGMNLLNIGSFLWKKKFYYLSKWYLESSIDESIIKELTILTNILICLAGTAAQDSWILLKKTEENSFSIDKLIENDFSLAFSILESLFSEFPWLEICQNNLVNCKKKKILDFPTKSSFSIMQNGIFAITNKIFIYNQNNLEYKSSISQQIKSNRKKCYEFKNTTWSPRFLRLSFFRSHFFDWIKRPNDFEFSYNFRFSKKKAYLFSADLQKENNYGQFIENKKKEQLLYERILPRIRRRNVHELESQFEEMLLEEQFEILGSFRLLSQYSMEYQLYNKAKLFIGKRILWNPIGFFYQIRHFVFSRREFFLDEEMLRRLYVTYGARRERERSRSSKKIKQFFLCRGYNKDLISKLSIRWWTQLPIDEKQNIDTLKRIEHIGIPLKRPQNFTPVYLYQRWLIENSTEKFFRFELLNNRQKWLKINSLLFNDSFIYTTLLESYKYLLSFFMSNKKLLNQMTKVLLKKGWLFENEIEKIIHKKK